MTLKKIKQQCELQNLLFVPREWLIAQIPIKTQQVIFCTKEQPRTYHGFARFSSYGIINISHSVVG